MASEFIKETDEGLLYRIYVPAGRMWADETDRLIQLFRDYLSRVGRFSVRLDQQRTGQGTVYEFFSSTELGIETAFKEGGLALQFQEFSHLMDMSVTDFAGAEAFLEGKQLQPREVAEILTRYAKEAKRIHIDMRQIREQKVMSIRHRLESELTDTLPSETSLESYGI